MIKSSNAIIFMFHVIPLLSIAHTARITSRTNNKATSNAPNKHPTQTNKQTNKHQHNSDAKGGICACIDIK